jgi:hypothetical protein
MKRIGVAADHVGFELKVQRDALRRISPVETTVGSPAW